jgi:large subunit ribosomal protein L9
MKVILSENVDNVGLVGDIVEVSDGFGRNFLIPRKLAALATTHNVKQIEHQRRLMEVKRQRLLDEAKGVAGRIEALEITIAQKVGEEEKLFGSVTNIMIHQALTDEGIEIDRKRVLLNEPIRKLGEYKVPVKLQEGVVAQLKVRVVAEEQ